MNSHSRSSVHHGGMPPPKGTQSLHGAHANGNPRVRRGGSSNPCTSSPKRDERSLGEGANTPAAARSPSPVLPSPPSCPKEQEGPIYRRLLLFSLLFLCFPLWFLSSLLVPAMLWLVAKPQSKAASAFSCFGWRKAGHRGSFWFLTLPFSSLG